jgi:hypothetical protein
VASFDYHAYRLTEAQLRIMSEGTALVEPLARAVEATAALGLARRTGVDDTRLDDCWNEQRGAIDSLRSVAGAVVGSRRPR